MASSGVLYSAHTPQTIIEGENQQDDEAVFGGVLDYFVYHITCSSPAWSASLAAVLARVWPSPCPAVPCPAYLPCRPRPPAARALFELGFGIDQEPALGHDALASFKPGQYLEVISGAKAGS